MQRKFLFNLALLVLLNLLVKPFYILAVDTEFIVRLGQEVYGAYFALFNLSILTNIFLDFGTVNFNTGNIARNENLVTKHFSHILSLRMALAMLYVLISLLTGLILGYRGVSIYHLFLLCINQVLAGFILYFRSNLAGMQLFPQDSLLSVLDRLVLILSCSFVLWIHPLKDLSIELFIYLQTAAYSTGVLAGLVLVVRKAGRPGFRLKLPFTYLIMKKSFPYALLVLLMGFYYRTDGVMLERMLDDGSYQAGIYAQAFRFYEAGNMMALLFATLLFPMYSRLISQNDDVRPLLNTSFKLLTTGAVYLSFLGYFYANDIMDIRYDSGIAESAKAFKYLMIGFIGVSGTYIFGALLTANQSMRSLNGMAMFGVVVNIVLNLILIPTYKAEGAAFASMSTQLILAAYQIILVRREVQVGLSLKTWLGMAAFALIMALSFLSLHELKWDFAMASASCLGLAVFLVFLFRLITLSQMKDLLRIQRESKEVPAEP